MFRLIPILITCATIAFSFTSHAQKKATRGRHKIHVVTMGMGDELFARFGHIGLMVEDTKTQRRKVYNFGTFDFEDPDLQIKYARGFLIYWVSVQTWKGTVMRYQFFNRELTVRTLALTD